ncbi:hypothetical protein JCM3774_004649 [Rhodotorula dairenensis]
MDIDDELLGLAEGTTSKSRRSKSTKRKRPVEESSEDNDSASDMDMSASDSDAPAPTASSSRTKGGRVKSSARVDESDDDDDDDAAGETQPTEENPYPIEGIYVDEAERERISMLPELEREDFIATRQEEVTSRRLRRDVAQMAARSAGAASGPNKKKKVAAAASDDDEDDDDYGTGDSTSRTTRSRKTTGSSKTKSEGIEKLKQSRAAKGKKKQAKTSDSDDDYEDGPKKGRRRPVSDYSGSDMDESSDDGRPKKGRSNKGPAYAGYEELLACQATRTHLADMCRAPFFDEWVQNVWVRYPMPDGPAQQERRYRLYQVAGVKHRDTYRVEGISTDIVLELRYGQAITPFRLDAVSNSPATLDEYRRMTATFLDNKVALPTSQQAKKCKEELQKHKSYELTEEDISAQLAARNVRPSGAQARARLIMELSDAQRVNDLDAVARIRGQLAELDGPAKEEVDRAKRINDRNRAANREDIKRAEAKSQEERRKQAEALQRGDTNVKIDKSARVKTLPKHTYDSRPQTPGGSGSSTPVPAASAPAASSLPVATGQNGTPRPKAGKIESVVASRVQLSVDLDF